MIIGVPQTIPKISYDHTNYPIKLHPMAALCDSVYRLPNFSFVLRYSVMETACSIPKDNNLDIVFDAIAEAWLWRYDH